MMKELDQLVELDVYFKYYDIFNKYMSTVKPQYESIKDIKKRMNYEMDLSEEDILIAEGLDPIIADWEKYTELLLDKFNQFDFSNETVKENHNDYKILCYKFIKDSLTKYLDQYLDESGQFSSEADFLHFIDKLEILLLKFFSKNFIHTSEILPIFDKVRYDIIKGERQLQQSGGKYIS